MSCYSLVSSSARFFEQPCFTLSAVRPASHPGFSASRSHVTLWTLLHQAVRKCELEEHAIAPGILSVLVATTRADQENTGDSARRTLGVPAMSRTSPTWCQQSTLLAATRSCFDAYSSTHNLAGDRDAQTPRTSRLLAQDQAPVKQAHSKFPNSVDEAAYSDTDVVEQSPYDSVGP